jgi:hypothetical protein
MTNGSNMVRSNDGSQLLDYYFQKVCVCVCVCMCVCVNSMVFLRGERVPWRMC